MTPSPDTNCCHVKWTGWGSAVCGKPAKMEYEGKPYCGLHDPIKAKAKRDATDARWRAEMQTEKAKRIADAAAKSALELDAARYRILRRGQHWSVIDGVGDTLRAEALDVAIDAELKG